MELTTEQIYTISSSILISDVRAYIDSNPEKYQRFLERKKEREKKKKQGL